MRICAVHPAEIDARPVIKWTRRLTASEQEEMRELHQRGWRVPALMARYDLPRRSVYRLLEGTLVEGRAGPFSATFWLRPGRDPVRIEAWVRDA